MQTLIKKNRGSLVAAIASTLIAGFSIGTPVQAAQGFLAAISPARLELKAEPGKKIRGALTIRNLGRSPANYLVRSSEWDFTEAGQSVFSDAVPPDSCRPWLRLERRKVSVKAEGRRNFRYEFHVPAGTPARECRLAIMIEGEDAGSIAQAGGGMALPVKGRMGVIIYLAVGNVKSSLQLNGVSNTFGASGHMLSVANSGNASDRLSGLLRGVDANNKDFDVSVSNEPVLPGQRRNLGLVFSRPGTRDKVTPQYPVDLKGDLFWQNGTIPVKLVLNP